MLTLWNSRDGDIVQLSQSDVCISSRDAAHCDMRLMYDTQQTFTEMSSS